jgi:hypothetical protein
VFTDHSHTGRWSAACIRDPNMSALVTTTERQNLLDKYAATSLAFANAVERLRVVGSDTEAFIVALAQTGTARRACERSRLRLERQLAGGSSQEA